MRSFYLLLFLLLFGVSANAQTGVIQGVVVDKLSNQPVPFAPVGIVGTSTGVTADENGKFTLSGLAPGVYNLEVKALGYRPYSLFEVQVSGTRIRQVRIELEEEAKNLAEVEVRPDQFVRIEEAPVSRYNIGETEVKRTPGGNRDISKALQSLPGVAATASFRNDLIIRGGSSNENRFYLDGIEVPNINHFSTQGATGGPVGMINVDFIRDVDFFSGAFPAARGNTMSSVLDFKLKDGRPDKTGFTFTLGASDLAATVDGPIGENVSYIASWRRSYLQFLFQAIGLPFLPRYDDILLKTRWRIDQKNEVSFIGLGAYDVVTLNESDNETDYQKYLLNNIPENTQWNYTVGASWKHYREKGYSTFVISRNELQNQATKYYNNDESNQDNLILDYTSRETENKFRFENINRLGLFKINSGVSLESAGYSTTTYDNVPYVGVVDYTSSIDFLKYGFFGQASASFFKEKLSASFGLRFDGNSYSSLMSNPLDQFSPRLSLSYSITDKLRINANTGIYYQLPPYTVLGFKDSTGTLSNKPNTTYVRCDHYVAGIEYLTGKFLRITIEAFYKNYSQYPFDLRDSISIANLGNDFGVIGNTPSISNNEGRSYGFEILAQQKLNNNVYGIIAYTFLKSEFQDINGNYDPSSWDYRHTISLTAGRYFKKNWEAGVRYRFNSGQPYTPYDVNASMVKTTWDVTGTGIPDKALINADLTDSFHQLDIRVDKKYYFKKWSLNLFLDVQNILNYKTSQQDYLSVQRDANNVPITNPQNTDSYLPLFIENENGSIIPTFGMVVEF